MSARGFEELSSKQVPAAPLQELCLQALQDSSDVRQSDYQCIVVPDKVKTPEQGQLTLIGHITKVIYYQTMNLIGLCMCVQEREREDEGEELSYCTTDSNRRPLTFHTQH